MRGIFYNGQHSWYTHHAVISASEKPLPRKQLTEERVPYSNVSYDFSCLNGKQAYEDRTLKYVLSFWAASRAALLRKYRDITRWLYAPAARIPLYDDEEEGIHYLAKCTEIAAPEITGTVCVLTVTFTAYPLRIPDRPSVIWTVCTAPFPDVNGDGSADALDAAMILEAATAIATGQDPGLTEAQLDLADADRDGTVSAVDASLVSSFSTACGIGQYTNDAAGWVAFMNDQTAKEEGWP